MANEKLKASTDCFELVKFFEGCKLTAYKDSAGIWTIGIGSATTGGFDVRPGMTITMETAKAWFLQELTKVEKQIRDTVKVELTQSQFDALCSFVYNLGIGSLQSSTLLRRLNARESAAAVAPEFNKWTKAKVKGVLTELPGLVSRRKAESLLFQGLDWRTKEHIDAGIPAPVNIGDHPDIANADDPLAVLRGTQIT